MKTVGIIGGVGPETTSNFYLYITAECQRLVNTHRPNILINSVPIRYDIEESLLLHNKGLEKFLPFLIESARILEKSGANFIVMPCNTLHCFESEIRSSINIPFISIIDVVTNFIKNSPPEKIGLIATSITLSSGFYQKRFKNIGIEFLIPDKFQQAKIAKMIHGLVTGKYANNQREILVNIINEFSEQGISKALLACTDLQALIPHHPNVKIIDTMQLLAEEVVEILCNQT